MATEFEPQGKRVSFDGDEVIEPYHVSLMRFLAPLVPMDWRQLWMQETEGGDWFLVFTRDSPYEPMRNPTLEEMTS